MGKGEETGETSEKFDLFNNGILTGLTGLVDRARFHVEWLISGASSDWRHYGSLRPVPGVVSSQSPDL